MTPRPVPELEAEWARAVKTLTAAGEICLACHIRPDADALGSMLAAAHALRDCLPRATVIASFGDRPFEVPRILRFLPGAGLRGASLPGAGLLSPPEQVPDRPQVMVTFDAASPDRLGLLEAKAQAAGELIVLDHHASNTGFGTVHLVDPAAAATAVLAFELTARLGAPLSSEIAHCLYAGLVTDTGSFKYSATTPGVHEMAARLLAAGVDPEAVAHELWDRAPFGYLGMLAAALGRAVLERGGDGLVWTTVTRADRAASGLLLDAAEPVIDVVRRTEEADVAAVLKEADDGHWQVSVRSKGRIDVGQVCVALGGGGHARAAGFSSHGSAEETIAALRRQLSDSAGEAVPAESGLIIVDKPGGCTSHDVVARIRRLAGTRRVGHAGTLDPMATGVLVIGVEKATRLLGHLVLADKDYTATIRLGQDTDTDDADGQIVAARPAGQVTEAELAAAMAALTGEIAQVPPGISAVKVGGQRAYRLTRAGAAPELAARTVAVTEFRLLALRHLGEVTDADVAVTCSSGTYIRALARDVGRSLGTGGHLTVLRRTRVGPYRAAEAATLGELEAGLRVIPLATAAGAAFPRRDLTDAETRLVSHGGRLPGTLPGAGAGTGPVAAFGPDGTLIALLDRDQARPLAVFVP